MITSKLHNLGQLLLPQSYIVSQSSNLCYSLQLPSYTGIISRRIPLIKPPTLVLEDQIHYYSATEQLISSNLSMYLYRNSLNAPRLGPLLQYVQRPKACRYFYS